MFDTYFNNRIFILYLCPFVLGLLTVFSFQPFNLTFINFIILPFIFYLVILIKKKSKSTYRKKPYKKNLFIFGTVFGFSFYLSGIHWITHSLTFDQNLKFLIPIALIIIPLFLSLFFSVTILVVASYLNLNLHSILIFSGAFAFSDFVRSKILTGFPWNLWAYSFSWATEVIQILSVMGLFAFNLLIITLFTLPAVLFFKTKKNVKIITFLIIFLTFFILYMFGNYSINQNKIFLKSQSDKFNVKVVSPNLDLRYNLSTSEIEDRLKKLVRYSEPNIKTKTLFIWPEGPFSGYSYDEVSNLKKIIQNHFGDNNFIIFGINSLNKEKDLYYNSLVLINNKFEIIKRYNKQKLVPFGEFLPLEKYFKNIGLKKVTEGHGSFLKGEDQENIVFDNLNILPLICYEVIFTKFIQKADRNTNLIINISEDGWFGNSIGPNQHFAKAIFRAIEQNSFFIRSANKGISAIISNKGEVIEKLNMNDAGNIEFDVPLIKKKYKNTNDLIFFILLFTYLLIYIILKKDEK
jgi:apolipoprotein N-acyltransferase